MAGNEWVRLGNGESTSLLLVRPNDVGYDLASGFQDGDTLRRDAHRDPLFVAPDEALAFAAQLPEVKALVEALRIARGALEHDRADCWSTGPNTGDAFVDLVVCPGCSAIALIDHVRKPFEEDDNGK